MALASSKPRAIRQLPPPSSRLPFEAIIVEPTQLLAIVPSRRATLYDGLFSPMTLGLPSLRVWMDWLLVLKWGR